MKQSVIIELSNAELIERLDEKKKQLVKLKINHAVSPLDNPLIIKEYRKTVARIKTEIRKRELNEAKKAE
ncbi:MAG: 50S ribosomal protein L29 [Bacteroidales bacterium]|nr:50S ribosomal protein L29 [Bacteroidales bacterium]MDD4576050.1 50S ribosomal protein L29 [Bacteroidales bacterium]MDY0216218.1 50S ribosomal protein L29 [Bacteroidales bacterium]